MKVIQVMFDTLKRSYLSPYESSDVITPNFDRLAAKTVRLDNFFAGSLPCMPARRDLHTGRYNFLHRSWGPIEPFDDSMSEILRKNDIYTHLVTDHKHYWRDGGSTYHPRYSSYEFIRGQEGDNWKPKVDKNVNIKGLDKLDAEQQQRKTVSISQDAINREHMPKEEDHTLYRTVEAGLEFLSENKDADNWFLQIECFDPHEPFFVPKKYLEMYGVSEAEFNGWLLYTYDDFSPKKKEIIKGYYKALLTMCDAYLGKVLDFMDEWNLWNDTMLIVNTDHGFMLGEHEWWGKNIMPVYNEIAQIPFFIWNPQLNKKNESRDQLAQTIDVPATILDFFGLELPKDMKGKSLKHIIKEGQNIHDEVLFGYFGSNINITDGEYVYMRAPMPNSEELLHEYTLSPMRINRRFTTDELKSASLDDSFNFTKGIKVLKVKSREVMAKNYQRFGNKLFNYKNDPHQKKQLENISKEFELITKMKALMIENEAPDELYKYYGLDAINSEQDLMKEHEILNKKKMVILNGLQFNNNCVKEGYLVIESVLKDSKMKEKLKKHFNEISMNEQITENQLKDWVENHINKEEKAFTYYQLNMALRAD